MLTLTPTAVRAVRTLVAEMEINDETGGLRIAPGELAGQGTTLEVALVDEPESADDEVEADGAHVFLEPLAARLLDDKLLDATVQQGLVKFMVFERDAPRTEGNGR